MTTETHESLASSALEATKALHDLLGLVSVTRPLSNSEVQQMKTLNKTANNAVAAMRRHHVTSMQQAGVSEALLREALHGEMLDRRARSARLEERYRALSDTRTMDSAIEAARRATLTLDRSLASLCSHHHAASSGTHQTQQMAVAAAAAT